MKKLGVLLILIVFVLGLTARCNRAETGVSDAADVTSINEYQNLNDTVAYVGKEVCRACHQEIYDTYIETGMGKSFDVTSTLKSASQLSPESKLYDEYLDLWYLPFWKGEEMMVMEYRLQNKDTVHKRIETVDYIIGSGQHTNSHLTNRNGYLHQAPFTYYTQDGKLDFPPGFENGKNTRFGRTIGLECMSCHNSLPEFELGSGNKFNGVPDGISCERCHGPGQIHVIEKSQGNIVDTSKYIDYTIVNPSKLEGNLQFEICQRCHLQGNAVLKPGKDWYDFKPGMRLDSVMTVFLPRYEGADNEFIMASHVDRFKLSDCYINAEKTFNCISCHNPHKSVTATQIETFNSTCSDCHSGSPTLGCTEQMEVLEKANFNCVECHMPSSTSIDIPHVTVHDHKIRIPTTENNEVDRIRKFAGLYAVNSSRPDPRTVARGYLQQFEKFTGDPQFLDSAEVYIERANYPLYEEVNWYFLKNDAAGLTKRIEERGVTSVLEALSETNYTNDDAWTAYRIGQSFDDLDNDDRAVLFYDRAVQLAPFELDFRIKYGSNLISLKRREEARIQMEFVYSEYPYYGENLNNLGFFYVQEGDLINGKKLYNEAVSLHPDYLPARMNRAGLALYEERWADAKADLMHVLAVDPKHKKAQETLAKLETIFP